MSDDHRIFSSGWKDYELIDAGGNMKLERWGNVITIRPERQAYFRSKLTFTAWEKKAHLIFDPSGKKTGTWRTLNQKEKNENWSLKFEGLTFNLTTTKFKHVGLFPEQHTNWQFIKEHIQPGEKFLNLFAYTGASSLIACKAGAEVTHVDSVKQLITWARNNMEASNLNGIKWVHEDALKFAQREVKRGNKYQFIVMDPPAWGIGAKKEKWKIEDQLPKLIALAHQLLEHRGTLVLNTYSPKVDLKTIAEHVSPVFNQFTLQELWMKTTTGKSMFFGHLLRARK